MKKIIIFFIFIIFNLIFLRELLLIDGLINFNDFSVFTNIDFLKNYLLDISVLNLFNNYGALKMNFFNEYIPYGFIYVLGKIFGYELGIKLFFILGISLINFSFFSIFYKITKGKNIVIIVLFSLLITFNLWFFDRLQQGHIFNLLFFLILFPYFIYYSFFKENNIKLIIILFLSILSYYHYFFILIYILFFKYIFEIIRIKNISNFKQVFIKNFKIGLSFLLLISPFILVYIYNISTFTGISNSVANTDILKLFSFQSNILSSLFHLRTGMYSYEYITIYKGIYILGLIGIYFFVFYLTFHKNSNKKNLFLLGFIFFSLSFLYSFNPDLALYFYNIPTFNVFRDMNKFLGISFYLILFYIVSNLYLLKKEAIILKFCLLLVITPFILTPYNYFNYIKDEVYYEGIDNFSNVLIIPYDFPIIENNNGSIFHRYSYLSQDNYLRVLFKPYYYNNDASDIFKKDFFYYINNYNKSEIKNYIHRLGLNYIYLYKNLLNSEELGKYSNLFQDYNIYYDSKFLRILKISDKKMLLSTNYIILKNYNISINIKNISDIFYLSSTINFNPNWKLYLKNQQGIFSKPLFENTHHLVYDYANGWNISKNEIISYVNDNYSKELQKEGYPKQIANGKLDYKYYVLNSDGSIDVELTLYFKPQSYFYLGLIISGTTFIILIGYLCLDVVRNRRRKEEENQTV